MLRFKKSFLLFCGSCLLIWLSSFAYASEGSNAHDLLQQAFEPSIMTNRVVWGDTIGETTESVGNYVLKEGTKVDASKLFKKWEKVISKRPSLLIQISKFLLRITVVLAITMIIYNGIMYLIKASKGENPKEIIGNLVAIFGGVLLALFSVIIIRLIASIGTSSISL